MVKGNLRHRIEKLGTEKAHADLTPDQLVLRKIAVEQAWGEWPPERPSWANGAFLYLTRRHAKKIQEVVQRFGMYLQSKHILVSKKHEEALRKCLDAKPACGGREAFLISRAGMIQSTTYIVLLPPQTEKPARHARSSWRTPTLHWLRVLDPDVVHEFIWQHADEPFLNDDMREALCFFAAPITVQELAIRLCELAPSENQQVHDPREYILRLWEAVCFENSHFLQMSKSSELLSRCAYCGACGKEADAIHMHCAKHRDRVKQHGPLLQEVLRKNVPAGWRVTKIFKKCKPMIQLQ